MKKLTWLILAIALASFYCACGSDSSDDDDDSADDDMGDDDVDDDVNDDVDDDSDDDVDDDVDDDTQPGSWDGIELLGVTAPDEYSMEVELSGDPGDAIDDLEQYAVDSDNGDLDVAGAVFDDDGNILTLTTNRQKLGVTYTLDIDTGARGLAGDFLAADTARLWAWDFEGEEDYSVTARRVAVGEHCVVYLEQGWSVQDVNDSVEAFDEFIYPTETEIFYPAPDMDGNDRILIFGLNGHGWYGGYFSGINAYSDDQAWNWWGYHSNEMEMVYINVEYDTLMPYNVIPHEFQHLLYNHRHETNYEYWEYHDEGLAESAVHAVFGPNRSALYAYMWDYNETIREGLSLIHWEWGNYDYYAQAYMWWIYVASRLGGLDALSDIFDLDTGSPEEVDQFLTDNLGSGMAAVLFENNIALWAQAATGKYGYEGLMDFEGQIPYSVSGGTTSRDLESYSGAYFRLSETEVNYPGTEGDDIVYAGVNGAGDVDLEAPFDIDGGALLVHNLSTQYPAWPQTVWETQHSGPDLTALEPPDPQEGRASFVGINPAWMDPPPLHPERMDRVYQWREKALQRVRGK